jgi:hypothetical protein
MVTVSRTAFVLLKVLNFCHSEHITAMAQPSWVKTVNEDSVR